MRVEDEEIHLRSIQPIMARVGGVDFEGQKAVRVTITVMPMKGQTTDDLDLATASFIHAQELFGVLNSIVSELESTGGPGDALNEDLFEEAQLLLRDVKEYW